jgi:hypothetical protein
MATRTVSGVIQTLRTAISFAEREKNSELLVSLNKALLDANELISTNLELREQIRELESQLAFKGSLVRHKGAYFEKDQADNPIGTPYCSRCWEVKHLAVHIVHLDGNQVAMCPDCRTNYSWTVMKP